MSDIQEEIKIAHRKALEQDFNEIIKELKQEEHKNLELSMRINKAVEYIKEQTKKTNYNDFIHCIWYIIKGQRAEDGEIKYLKELKKAYINVHIPLVIIYLNEYGDGKIKKMEESLKDLNVNFEKVIAENIKRPEAKTDKARGEKKLLSLALNKCNEER